MSLNNLTQLVNQMNQDLGNLIGQVNGINNQLLSMVTEVAALQAQLAQAQADLLNCAPKLNSVGQSSVVFSNPVASNEAQDLQNTLNAVIVAGSR